MKILYVSNNFPPEGRGGTELHVHYLAREMVAIGHDVAVVTRSGRDDRADYEVERGSLDGIEVVRINYQFRDAASFEWIYRNPNIDAIVKEELERLRPDLVHVHHLTCLSTGILDVVKDAGIPLVMTLHDFWMVCPRGQRIDPELEICATVDRLKCHACLARLWPHFFPGVDHDLDTGALRALGRPVPEELAAWDAHVLRVLSRCDLLLTPSEFHREKMLEFDLDPDRIEALPHGLDHALLRAERDADAPAVTIGFIGSVIPSKGVHVLVDAFTALGRADLSLRVHGEELPFHGQTGYVDDMRAGIPANLDVEFTGAYEQEDLPRLLAELDVLVVPSLWWESFCLTIREGLLAGAAVVAAGHGPMVEALDDGRRGVLFEPGDASDLAAKLGALVDDPARLKALRNRGAEVKTIEANARETLERYRVALQRAGKDPAAAHDVPLPARRELRETASPPDVPVTVFIPTWNGGALFETVLERVFAQRTDFEFEVLVIDSGSTDETLEIIARHPGVRLIQIPNSEFNHGLTRNRAVREARGAVVALLTQDAVPYDESWLANLVSNFDDPEVAGAYCHQLPRDDCNPFQRDRLEGWTRGEGGRVVKQVTSRGEFEALDPMGRYQLIAFDDVASCVRKTVMETIPFERRQFGEDVAWAKQAVLAGWKVVMDPNAVVVHSHNNSVWYEFKRVYLDHQNLHDLVGMHLVRRLTEVFRFTLDGTRHLGGVIRRSKIGLPAKLWWWARCPFYSLGQNMGQYLGARSVIEKRRGLFGVIDRILKKGV